MIAEERMAERVAEIVNGYPGDGNAAIAVLQDMQAEFHYLPREGLLEASRRLKVPLSQLYSIATFYRAFSLVPRGVYTVKVCLGTACHVRGAVRVLEKLERELGVQAGGTTSDLNFTLETVNCLGACALGPLVMVGGKYFGKMNPARVNRVLDGFRQAKGGNAHDTAAES